MTANGKDSDPALQQQPSPARIEFTSVLDADPEFAFGQIDVETEEEILRELKQFMRGRTTLLISHRISTVREADIIAYLRDGEIIEQGTHEELLSRRGAYYDLFRHQSLSREVEVIGGEERRL